MHLNDSLNLTPLQKLVCRYFVAIRKLSVSGQFPNLNCELTIVSLVGFPTNSNLKHLALSK